MERRHVPETGGWPGRRPAGLARGRTADGPEPRGNSASTRSSPASLNPPACSTSTSRPGGPKGDSRPKTSTVLLEHHEGDAGRSGGRSIWRVPVAAALEAVQQPVGVGGIAARLELPEPDEPRHAGVGRLFEQMLEVAPKPGRDPFGDARFDPALRVHQRVGAGPLDRRRGRQDGSRASAGLDEPAD